MNFVSALTGDVARLWLALSYPETALIVLSMVPVLLLLGRRLSLIPILFAVAAIAVYFLGLGMNPLMVAAFLIAGNAALTTILVAIDGRRSAGLEARLTLAEESICELQVAEERRRAVMARDVVQQFPGPHKGRPGLDETEQASHVSRLSD